MSNYTKSTNFATKDNLPTGDPLKIVKGTEINTEFDNISTAIATKTDNSSAAITGGTITGITDLAIADGGTGASTATAALNNLLPSQTSAANKYLQSDGTNASWDAVTLSTSDITGTLAVANGGTGVTSSTGTGSTVLSNSPTLVTPTLGTPASATLTNATGLPISTGVSGLGTGVASALSVNTGQNNAVVLFNGALGTPSSGTVTNLTGTASININGTVGAVGPASGSFTTLTSSSTVTINGGTANGIGYLNGSKVFTTGTVLKFDGTNITSDRSVGTAYSGTSFSTWANGIILNNSATPATGLLDSIYFTNNANMQNVFGVAQNASGYGDFVWAGYAGTYTEWMKLTSAGLSITGTLGVTGVATLGAGAILNTPASVTLTNATGLPLTTGVTGTLPTANGGTNLTSFTSGGVVYASSTSALATGSALTFDGTTLAITGPVSSTRAGTANYVLNDSSSSTSSSLQANSSALYFNANTGAVGAGSFIWRSSSALSELMRLTSTLLYTASTVNIAIGASSGTSGTRLTIQESAANSAALSLLNRNSTQNWKIAVDGVSVDDKLLAFIDNGTSQIRMALTDTGNLGIGTSSPVTSLDVRATNGATIIAGRTANTGTGSEFGYFASYAPNASGTDIIWSQIKSLVSTATAGSEANSIVFSSRTAGSFTEKLRIDSAGNVGIGTSSPTQKLEVNGAAQFGSGNTTSSGGLSLRLGVYTTVPSNATDAFVGVHNTGGAGITAGDLILMPRSSTGVNNNIVFLTGQTTPTARATIDSAGNLGLGVTPSAWGASKFAMQLGARASLYGANNLTVLGNNYYDNGTNNIYIATAAATDYYQSAGTHVWRYAASGTAGNAISFTQAMTLEASGRLLVGTTSTIVSATEIAGFKGSRGISAQSTGGSANFAGAFWNDATTGDNVFVKLYTDTAGTERGSITYNRTAGLVAYNTTSDYRAKDISGPVTGSGALIDSTPVYMGTMKGATQERPMFLAHEVPAYAHTGEKDAVDEDGNPVYQQMDASALIPVMWAEIQSLRARVAQLETN